MTSGVFQLKKIALLLALALCLLSASALADVQRGDHGEEVRYLQWLLQQTGWLKDNPDGSFGPRTEQAVMDYQESKGHEATGIADDALMLEMDEDRVAMDQEKYGTDYYQPYPGNFDPPMVAAYGAPNHCRTTVLRDILYRDSCSDHLAVLEQEYNLAAQGGAESLSLACALWQNEIEAQFDAWSNGAPAAQREDIEADRAGWEACFEAQRAALSAVCDDPATVERQLDLMMKNYAGAMCEFLSGDMPNTPSEDYLSESAVSTEPCCRQWAINAGTEFVTGCAAHAPLFDREYEWTKDGADNPVALIGLMTDWDAALAAMYDQWAARSGDAVRDAQSAFQAAILLQDAALADGGFAPLAHVRVVQMECARLCELLHS